MTKSRSKDCLESNSWRQCSGFITEYYVPQERYILHLAEAKLKEDILDYNWTPKPTKLTMDAK